QLQQVRRNHIASRKRAGNIPVRAFAAKCCTKIAARNAAPKSRRSVTARPVAACQCPSEMAERLLVPLVLDAAEVARELQHHLLAVIVDARHCEARLGNAFVKEADWHAQHA